MWSFLANTYTKTQNKVKIEYGKWVFFLPIFQWIRRNSLLYYYCCYFINFLGSFPLFLALTVFFLSLFLLLSTFCTITKYGNQIDCLYVIDSLCFYYLFSSFFLTEFRFDSSSFVFCRADYITIDRFDLCLLGSNCYFHIIVGARYICNLSL